MKYEINQWIVMAVYVWLIRNLKRNADLGTVKTSWNFFHYNSACGRMPVLF